MSIRQPVAVAAVGDSISYVIIFDNSGAETCDVTDIQTEIFLPNTPAGSPIPILVSGAVIPGGDGPDAMFECPGPDARCVSHDLNDYRYVVSDSDLDARRSGCPPNGNGSQDPDDFFLVRAR